MKAAPHPLSAEMRPLTLRDLGWLTASLVIVIAPHALRAPWAALVLFVLFPRVQGPLWGLPQDAFSGMTGLSETMSPGNLSQLALSDAIAFRAAFEGESPPQPLRYWRGPVLWDFDGRTWSTGVSFLVPFREPQGGSARYQYSVILEAHNRYWMRAAGVPARVVTGYQGGELNPVDSIITGRQSDAHAWTEVYIAGRGWLRIDPTAAAMPRRLDGGLARALPQDQALPLMMRPEMEWLRSARYRWEAVAHKWNVWVLGYNPERQRDLMLSLGMRDADWQKLTAVLFTFLGAMTVALLVWSLRRLTRPDPVQNAWQKFCRKLAARGVVRSAHEGPRDYAARAARALPAVRRPILRIAALYIALRYGANASKPGMARLQRLVRQLEIA